MDRTNHEDDVLTNEISIREYSARYGIPKNASYDKISTLRKGKRKTRTSLILTLTSNFEEKTEEAKKSLK